MMKVFIHFSQVLLCLCLLLFIGCKKDELISEEIISSEPTTQAEEFFQINLNGLIRDQDDQVVANASVIVDSEILSSSDNGFFTATNINAPNTGLYIKVLKDGYFTGGTHFYPTSAENSGIEITLLKKEYKNFVASAGFNGEFNDGAKVMIPPSGIQREGQDYNGTVTISSTWLDPEDESTFNTMPGALIAQNEAGEAQFLQTYGMIAVEMTDDAGQELQLKDGVTAELSFPLSSSLETTAPESIPLWHFDEVAGVWKEEGKAEKRNGRYIAEVPHFSWWNCDYPYDVTKVCLNITDQRGATINNLKPCLSNNNINSFCNPPNIYCGLVPTDEVFTLELRGFCDEIIHTQSIGPFDGTLNDINTVDITIPIPDHENLNFSGFSTNCTGSTLLDNGIVSVNIDGNEYFDLTIIDGEYDINLINCSFSASQASLTAFDIAELASGTQLIDLVEGQTVYETNIAACGTMLTEIFTINDGTNVSITSDVVAYESASETLIIAKYDDTQSESNNIIGFIGSQTGEYLGNVINSDFSIPGTTIPDNATITITKYDDVGGYIVGKFINGDFEGSFIAKRER